MKKLLSGIKKNSIILIIFTIVILFLILKDDWKDIIKAFTHLDIKYIILAFIFYFLSIIIKGYVNYKITNDKTKVSLKEAIKHNFIAQFFNGITPFSTGGQPMEIYMLTEHNISVANATNQTIQSFIFYQIALVICGTIAVLYNFIFHIFPKVKLLQNLVLIGFIINIAVAVVLFMITYSRNLTDKLSNFTIKLIKKFKNDTNEEEIKSKFNEFHTGAKQLRKRKNLFITGVILNIASLLCLYSVPIFVLYSMGEFNDLTMIDTIVSSAYVYVIGGFVPIPGGTGGMEFGFNRFFGNFIKPNMLSAVLIIWRTITYYIGIILGGALFSLEKKVK